MPFVDLVVPFLAFGVHCINIVNFVVARAAVSGCNSFVLVMVRIGIIVRLVATAVAAAILIYR